MENGALNGSAATTLLASNIRKATRAVAYTEPAVNIQLTRNKEIADCVISTRSTRDSTCVVISPFPESYVSSLVAAAS